MNTTFDEPPDKPKKTALQQIQEQFERQMRPLRQIEEMENLVKRHSSDYQMKELARQFEPHRQIQEILGHSAISKHFQDTIDGSSIFRHAKSALEQYLPKSALAGIDIDNFRRAAGLDFSSNIDKLYETHLRPTFEHQGVLEQLRRQNYGALAASDLARQLTDSNSAFHAIKEAQKLLNSLLPTFGDIDFGQFASNEEDEQETKQAAESITRMAAEQESIQKFVEHIVIAIQAQRKPAVQLMLWLFFLKVLEWLVNGAIGATMGHYAPAVLGESPQAAKKAIQENARTAVGSAEILADYRYVSIKTLIVRQTPKARSPEVGRLSFSNPVKLLKKENDFALIIWTNSESGAEIQGWVFSRYLGKFN